MDVELQARLPDTAVDTLIAGLTRTPEVANQS
jgi:hypothetical protein